MGTLKTFLKYILWIIAFYLFTSFLIFVGFNASYKNIESKQDLPKQITIDKAEATKNQGRIYGYVQIPCIERNAVAAMRAVDSAKLSKLLVEDRKVSFDLVVDTMYETGKDLGSHYRETSEGGLAKKYCKNNYYNREMLEE